MINGKTEVTPKAINRPDPLHPSVLQIHSSTVGNPLSLTSLQPMDSGVSGRLGSRTPHLRTWKVSPLTIAKKR